MARPSNEATGPRALMARSVRYGTNYRVQVGSARAERQTPFIPDLTPFSKRAA